MSILILIFSFHIANRLISCRIMVAFTVQQGFCDPFAFS